MQKRKELKARATVARSVVKADKGKGDGAVQALAFDSSTADYGVGVWADAAWSESVWLATADPQDQAVTVDDELLKLNQWGCAHPFAESKTE